MKIFLTTLLLIISTNALAHDTTPSCNKWPSWFQPACNRLHSIWTEGNDEIYLTGYAWHNRYTYTPEKIQSFNENAWGGGFGKGLYDEKGNWHGLYAIAFMDSHNHVEPAAGYAYMKAFSFATHAKIALGLSFIVTSRVDIYNSIPFPGILPWASLSYKKATLAATYIPGAQGAGNVLFIIGKYTLDI